jgi:hypothetical protein
MSASPAQPQSVWFHNLRSVLIICISNEFPSDTWVQGPHFESHHALPTHKPHLESFNVDTLENMFYNFIEKKDQQKVDDVWSSGLTEGLC